MDIPTILAEGTAIVILGVLFYRTLVFVFVTSLVWIYQDAQSRGKPGFLVAILAAFICWPISLLVWVALRPNKPGDNSISLYG